MSTRAWERPAGRPLVLGHRGASAHFAENTLAAFEGAMAAGADGVELDVRLCGSGEVVVFHDDDLKRLAGRDERVADVPLSELRRIDLGGGAGIPTLEETFAALGAALVNVEIKKAPLARLPELTGKVAAVIGQAQAAQRVLISSFDPRILGLLSVRAPELPRGLLFHGEQSLPLRAGVAAPLVRAAALHPHHGLVTAPRLARWHRRGLRVNVWTVDEPARVQELSRLGVDAIIANDPGAALAAVGGA